MRDISGILGVNRSSFYFYYQPREDPAEEGLRAEIEKLVPVSIQDTSIGVSRSCWCVWDTPLEPAASLG